MHAQDKCTVHVNFKPSRSPERRRPMLSAAAAAAGSLWQAPQDQKAGGCLGGQELQY